APKGAGMRAPVAALHAHFCGIHIAKGNPRFQLIVQHYCAPRGDDMHQCLLYDSCDKNARLLGVEYIVTDAVYRRLPAGEKRYWHPPAKEGLAGGLSARGMTRGKEPAVLKGVRTTGGKTGHPGPDPTPAVPLGEPLLMWAATGDGQIDPAVL